MYEFHTMLNLC